MPAAGGTGPYGAPPSKGAFLRTRSATDGTFARPTCQRSVPPSALAHAPNYKPLKNTTPPYGIAVLAGL